MSNRRDVETEVVDVHGIRTRYASIGEGPPLLLFSPGGFDSSLENWTTFGRYRDLGFIEALSSDFRCIVFDRRESGRSGGRIERLSWDKYVQQAVGLLDHLGIDEVHLMGGCVGCSTAAMLAVQQPGRVRSMVLFSPAGGVHYRRAQHRRFAAHLAFVRGKGLAAVVDVARSTDAGFSADPRVGPWAAVIRADDAFARSVASHDAERYELIVGASVRLLFDRDTVPGPEPEDLLALEVPALIVPGQDRSHAPSAARYLQECLTMSDYWNVPVVEQTAASASRRVREFLKNH